MIINRIYEKSKSSVAVACFLPGRAKDLSAHLLCQARKEFKTININSNTQREKFNPTLHPPLYAKGNVGTTWGYKSF
jgi:hypothetical protein